MSPTSTEKRAARDAAIAKAAHLTAANAVKAVLKRVRDEDALAAKQNDKRAIDAPKPTKLTKSKPNKRSPAERERRRRAARAIQIAFKQRSATSKLVSADEAQGCGHVTHADAQGARATAPRSDCVAQRADFQGQRDRSRRLR